MQKEFKLTICLEETNEQFQIRNVTLKTEIRVLKQRLELICGVPAHMQCLMYLDRGHMEDNSCLKHHDVVPGGRLIMSVWSTWKALLKACVNGNLVEVFSLGVTKTSKYADSRTKYMSEKMKQEFFLSRGSAALFICAHRGHCHILSKLLQEGVDYASTTTYGRTALHVAAAKGQDKCIDLLLSTGSGNIIHKEDEFGQSPLQLAGKYSHKSSERRLFLFQWQERATKMKLSGADSNDILRAHQMFDSSLKTWLRGSQSQIYTSNIILPEEYQGGALHSKLSVYKNIRSSKSLKEVSSTSKNK